MAAYKKPTQQDADLLIKLLQLNANPRTEQAMAWFSKEFKVKSYAEFKEKFPDGSPGAQHFGQIVGNFELAGVLVSHGLLNENLYFDVSPIGFQWERLAPIVEGQRGEMGTQLWENAAWLAERQEKWLKTVWKPKMAWKTAK